MNFDAFKNNSLSDDIPGKSPAVSGMTLIELLVVMFIMAIIATISIPAFTSMGRGSALRSAVSTFYTSISLARQWAITHKEEVTFTCYRDTAAGSGFTGSTFCVINQAGIYISSVVTNSLDVNFENSVSVTFKTDGGLTDIISKSITIQDRNEIGDPRIITIYGLTGGIKVE